MNHVFFSNSIAININLKICLYSEMKTVNKKFKVIKKKKKSNTKVTSFKFKKLDF